MATYYSASNPNPVDIRWRFTWLILAIYIFLLSATRVGGSDWENYEYLYQYMSQAENLLDAIGKNPSFEPGYIALNYIFHFFSEDRRALIVLESLINSYAIWLILTRAKGGVLLLAWLFPLQFANILAVRQTLATSLFLIAVLLLQGRASVFASISSAFIHLSTLILILGQFLQRFRLTWKSVVIGFFIVFIVTLITKDFLLEKLVNYSENAAELTGFSGLEILVGKGATIFLLLGLDIFSRLQPRKMVEPNHQLLTPQWLLYILYIAMLVVSILLPPFARILAPIELLIAWSVCGSILEIRDRHTRTSLALVIILIALAKILKIQAQLSDIYDVCFFCA